MITQLITKRNALEKGVNQLESEFTDLKLDICKQLNSIPSRTLPDDYINNDINLIKRRFGNLFYGALFPINGVSSKNRRYIDQTWKSPVDYQEARDKQGPAVWKYIGVQPQYGTRVHWADRSRVFDTLREEHIGLVLNGLRNRKDQVQVAKELYDIKKELDDQLTEMDQTGNKVSLNKTYELEILLTDDKFLGTILPYDKIPATCSKIEMNRAEIIFILDFSKKVEDYLKNTYKITRTSNYYGSGSDCRVTLELLDREEDKVPKGDFGWETKFIVANIHEPFACSAIDRFFEQCKTSKKEALDIIDEAEVKYAPRLLMKGAF